MIEEGRDMGVFRRSVKEELILLDHRRLQPGPVCCVKWERVCVSLSACFLIVVPLNFFVSPSGSVQKKREGVTELVDGEKVRGVLCV